MSASPYDAPLSAIRDAVEDLAVALAIWEARKEPDAHARRAASGAIDAIDAMIKDLHAIRQQLITEIREADDATQPRRMPCWPGGAREVSTRDPQARQLLPADEPAQAAPVPLAQAGALADPLAVRLALTARPRAPR